MKNSENKKTGEDKRKNKWAKRNRKKRKLVTNKNWLKAKIS